MDEGKIIEMVVDNYKKLLDTTHTCITVEQEVLKHGPKVSNSTKDYLEAAVTKHA